jgi:hypothetical protein
LKRVVADVSRENNRLGNVCTHKLYLYFPSLHFC